MLAKYVFNIMASMQSGYLRALLAKSEIAECTYTCCACYSLFFIIGIYVEAPDKSSGKRKQKIHISYDLIGFIPVDVLLKAEQV